MLGWSVAVFFLYSGLAGGLGAWTFVYLTEEVGLAGTTGGLVVTAYWVGFTASRLLLGAVGDRVDATRVLRSSVVATATGVAVFWLSPTVWVVIVALVLTGFAHGPIFPLEMLKTAERFGASLAATVVGFEIAAANVGAAIIPGSMGLVVERFGLTTVPAMLFAATLLVWVAIEGLRAVSAREVASPPDVGGLPVGPTSK
jgi:fucose permease